MKLVKKPLALLLPLVLIFCTAMMFTGSVSATVNESGTTDFISQTVSGYTATCILRRVGTSATATTAYDNNGVGAEMTSHARLYYATPASPNLWAVENNKITNKSTEVIVTASVSNSYTGKLAYGGHDVKGVHFETRK